MMNAEVTAENRPAYHPHQLASTGTPRETHKYQSCIQILIMLLHEILIILLSLLAVVLKELSPMVLLSG